MNRTNVTKGFATVTSAICFVTSATIAGATTVLHYDFSNNGDTAVTDRSGNGNDGTLVGFEDTTPGAGSFAETEGWVDGGGLSFLDDFVHTFVETGVSTEEVMVDDLGDAQDFTLEYLANLDDPNDWAPVIGSDQNGFSADGTMFVGVHNNLLDNEVRLPTGSAGPMGEHPWEIFDETPHHVAMVYDSEFDEIEMFVDGESVSVRAGNVRPENLLSTNFRFGAVGHATNEQWDGIIFEVAISDAKLDPENFVITGEPASAAIVITNVTYNNGEATITWTSSDTKNYIVNAVTDLIDGNWIELADIAGASGSTTTSFTDGDAGMFPARYYTVSEKP